MKKFKTNLKKLFTCFLCITILGSFTTMNIKASDDHSVKQERKARRGQNLIINGSDANARIATYAAEQQGECGTNVSWKLENGILTISGNGAMDDYVTFVDSNTGEVIEEESHRCPWEDYKSSIKEVYIEDGVTSVGSRAFADCYSLTKVVIGNSVVSIGKYAFTNDRELTDLTLGNSVETIDMDALYGISIKTLRLPASIKKLTNYSLLALWKLENIEISGNDVYQSVDGVLYTDGGKTIFLYPSSRSGEYKISSNVTKIAADAFAYSNLTKIEIPDSVKELGEGAFEYNESLQTLIFGNGITIIPESCCYYNIGLTSVTIPEGITTIEETAFWWCTSLKTITLPSTITRLERAFEKDINVVLLNENMEQLDDGTFVSGFHVNVEAKEMYKNAFEVLDLVNKERKKAGLSELVMDQSLLETAMLRGFENVIYWSHTRPCGADCFSANSKMSGENIAMGQSSPKQVLNSWMNSEGHRANILGSDYTSIGIGCVYINGRYYWVQCFGTEKGNAVTSSSYTDKNNRRNILVKQDKEYYAANMDIESKSLKVGKSTTVSIYWNNNPLKNSGAIIESSDPSVCEVRGEKLIAKKPGTANITMYYNGYREAAQTAKVTVSADTSKTKIKVPKASVKKLKNQKGKKVKITLKKVSNVKGYQIIYANNKKFKKASKITTTKTSLTIKKLKKKKTYYIKVRAYKKDASRKKVYGAYSSVKKIKIKY